MASQLISGTSTLAADLNDDGVREVIRVEHLITSSKSFHRLANKSQVVVKHRHPEHFMSRLTHTIEVNQIAETIGYDLGLHIPLINAIAYGHDIGHAPFGHAGERAIAKLVHYELEDKCDFAALRSALEQHYGLSVTQDRDGTGVAAYWLFHHALNSVRLLERKINVTHALVSDGVLKHSWSPWKPPAKLRFGVPLTYEGQAVAVADQIAAVVRDIEDIHNSVDDQHNIVSMQEQVEEIIKQQAGPNELRGAMRTAGEWFDLLTERKPEKTELRLDAAARSARIQFIVNDVINATRQRFDSIGIRDGQRAHDPRNTLTTSNEMGILLNAYEQVSGALLKEIAWFNNRDVIAESVIGTVFSFYGKVVANYKEKAIKAKPDPSTALSQALECHDLSTEEREYGCDQYYQIICGSSIAGQREEVGRIIRTLDYVAGMTENFIMEKHGIALELFD